MSEKIPVTAHCVVKPCATDGATGVTVRVESVAELTVNTKVAETPFTVAVKVVLPGIRPETRFRFAVVTNAAMLGAALDQTT